MQHVCSLVVVGGGSFYSVKVKIKNKTKPKNTSRALCFYTARHLTDDLRYVLMNLAYTR